MDSVAWCFFLFAGASFSLFPSLPYPHSHTATMESTRIEYIKENIYIPPQKVPERPAIPERHPSLILNDKISDAGLTFKCGCKGGKCIKETANWLYGPNGEINNPQEDCTKTEAYHFKNLIHDSVGRQL